MEEWRPGGLRGRPLRGAAAGGPGGIPAVVAEQGDDPAGVSPAGFGSTRPGAVPVPIAGGSPLARWERANVARGVARGTVSAHAHWRLGDVTARPFDGLAAPHASLRAAVPVTRRQDRPL